MSLQIDERIVELRFDNQQFEEGAEQSIKTLDKLKEALDIDGKEALTSLYTSIRTVTENFSVMEEVAKGVLQNIGMRAEQAGEQIVKSITVDQVSEGWGKFEEKTRAVQTIMAATGKDINEVNGYLEKLMWFTDETSYNFVDMTSNIGKFTSQGVALDTATTSMIGIANWAAKAGQGANEASRAMYNLAQSLGAGYVKYQDWMSVINANMDTQEFKQQVIDAAVALGTLNENFETMNGNLVTTTNFGENLTTDKWFTSDVLMKVLQDYGEYAEIVYQITQETGEATSDVMEALVGMYDGVGESAFRAGQEAKTFADVMDASKDAASSAWLTLFETIFGNYEEAKVIWTDLANGIYDVFVEPVNEINEVMAEWKDMGGRDVLFEGLYEMLAKLVSILDTVSGIWDEVFPPKTADQILSMTEAFTNFWVNLELTEPAAEAIHDILHAVFTVIRTGVDIVKAFVSAILPLRTNLNELAGNMLLGIADFARWVEAAIEGADITNKFANVFQTASDAVGGFMSFVKSLAEAIHALFTEIGGAGEKIFTRLKESIQSFLALPGELPIADQITEILNAISNFASGGGLSDTVIGIVNALADGVRALSEAMGGGSNAIVEFATSLAAFIFGTNFTNLTKSFQGIANSLKGIFKIDILGISEGINKLTGSLNSMILDFKKNGMVSNYLKVAAAVTAVALSLKLLSSIDSTTLVGTATVLTAVMAAMTSFTGKLGEFDKSKANIVAIGAAVLMIASALKNISGLNPEELVTGLAGVGVILAELAAFVKIIQNVKFNGGTAGTLAAIAISLNLMIAPMLTLSLLPLERAAQAVLGIGVVLMEVAAFDKLVEKLDVKGMLAAAGSITLMSVGLVAISGAIAAMGLLSLESLGKGLGGLGVALAEIGIALGLLSRIEVGNLLAAAGSLNIVAMALVPLTGAMAILGTMDLPSLGTALLGLLGIIAEMTAAMVVLEKAGGGGKSAAAGGAGIAALAFGLTALIPAMAALGAMSLPNIGKALIAIAGALGILTVAAHGVQTALPGVAAIAATFLAITAGSSALVFSIAELITSIDGLVVAFVTLSSMTNDEAANAGKNMVTFLKSVAQGISEMEAVYSTAFITLFKTMVSAIAAVIPEAVEALVSGVVALAQSIADHAGDFVAALIVVLQVIRDNIQLVTQLAVDIVAEFMLGVIFGIEDNVPKIIDALIEALETIIDSLVQALGRIAKDAVTWLFQTGKDIGQGLINGIKNTVGKIFGAGEEAGQAAIDGANEGAQTHSASEATTITGEDVGLGLQVGLFKSIPDVKKSAVTTATKGVIEPIKETLGKGGAASLTNDYMQGIIDGIVGKKNTVNTAAAEVASSGADTAIKTVEEKKVGSTSAKKVAKEIDEDKELEKAIKEKAQKISDIFSDEFTKVSTQLNNIGYEFDIWKAIQGPDAKEDVLKRGEIAQAQRQLQEYAKQYQIAYDHYQYLVENPELVQSPTELVEAQSEYLKYLSQMYTQANSIAALQKEMSDQYKQASETAMSEIFEIQQAQASLIDINPESDRQFKYNEAAQEAYEKFLGAATEEAKQEYYDMWQELAKVDYSDVLGGLPDINPDQMVKEMYKELGLDPDNPITGFLNVKDTVSELVKETTTAYLAGLEEDYRWMVGTYGEMIGKATDEATDQAVLNYPKFEKVGEDMMEATADGITISKSVVSYSAIDANDTAADAVNRKSGEWERVGEGMMDGVRKGIQNRKAMVIEEAIEVALAALAAAKKALGIASPSREFMEIGMLSVEGLAIGLENSKEAAKDASKTVVNDAVSPFASMGQRVIDALGDDMNPIITPYLDLSQVERNVGYLDELWTAATRSVAGDISTSEAARRENDIMSRQVEKPSVTYNETFTQNNYSPKALSAIEIYRQTNNQLNIRRRGVNR